MNTKRGPEHQTHMTLPAPVDRAGPIDLERFMGAWNVIAHVPYIGERGHVASRDEYTLRPDGKVDVRYVYREGFGEPEKSLTSKATVHPGTGNRRWTTWFFFIVPTKYRIVEVAPDYSWALIDYPGRTLAWIFARAADLDAATYEVLKDKLRAHGVDTTKLERVPRRADQVGLPGFGAPKKP